LNTDPAKNEAQDLAARTHAVEEKLKVIEKSQARCELELFPVNLAYAA
jgi:hypothetical protein